MSSHKVFAFYDEVLKFWNLNDTQTKVILFLFAPLANMV